eukprot:1153130-Pelagomonas_calceolata.AAC.4
MEDLSSALIQVLGHSAEATSKSRKGVILSTHTALTQVLGHSAVATFETQKGVILSTHSGAWAQCSSDL